MSFLDTLGDDWTEEAAVEAGETEQETEAKPEGAESQPEQAEEKPEEGQDEASAEETNQEAKFDAEAHRKMMDERRKRQELERERDDLRRQLEAKQPEKVVIPDAYEQPEQFNSWLQDQGAQAEFKTRAEISGLRAEMKYGEDTVKAATQWALESNDAALGMRVRTSDDPVGLVVKEYQRSSTLERLGDKSLEDYVKEQAIEKGWIVSPDGRETVLNSKPSSPTPPRSLASKPGSGGVGHTAQSDGFGEVFASTGMGLKR